MAKRYYSGEYEGYGETKRQESKDVLVRNETSRPANMPTDIKYHAWPSAEYYQEYNLNDCLSGVDDQIREDVSKAKQHRSKNKY